MHRHGAPSNGESEHDKQKKENVRHHCRFDFADSFGAARGARVGGTAAATVPR
jgi:hypothetical protein